MGFPMKKTLMMILLAIVHAANAIEPLHVMQAVASSSAPAYPAAMAVDGEIGDKSRWVGEKGMPAWIELKLDSTSKIAGVHIYSGYQEKNPLGDFVVQFWKDGKWEDIPSAHISGNQKAALAIPFDDTVEVNTDKIRLFITASPGDVVRLLEVVLWPAGQGDLPELRGKTTSAAALASTAHKTESVQALIPLIYLNQSGFNIGKPKRFTTPKLADGTKFIVRAAKGGSALFEGTLQGNVGAFSKFNPAGEEEFVVEAGGVVSVPFRIGNNWLERVSYQGMVDFMIDSRHYLGTWKERCGGSYGWRDDHHFGWELTTLVPQYLSNPSAYDRMPHQIKYEKPFNPALWGKLEPYSEDAPDIVKLIHWGADVLVTQGCKHEFLKAQLAYFIYAWPQLKKWLPAQNYSVVLNYTFGCWAEAKADRKYPYDASPEHNLLDLKTKIGSTKGELPPGFSVEPNLLMYKVALREKRPDSELYLQAAVKQAEWMVKNLDWNDPLTTKGQRMSEFVTMTGLAHLLRQYPDRAPAGLADKINEWAKVVIRRSANLWDFRKLDDGEKWTPMGEKATMWNEPGNVVGLPSAILAAQSFVKDAAMRERLEELIYSHFDNCFGRNPTGRHFSACASKEIEGVEFDWYKRHPGGIGKLENARFVLDGSPKNPAYPYAPEKGAIGWTEGWIQFNAAYDISMAYLAYANTSIRVEIKGGNLEISLQAPLNFDYKKAETGVVQVVTDSGDLEEVTVTETSADSNEFTGVIHLQRGAAAVKINGMVEVSAGECVTVSYGYGYLSRAIQVKVEK